MGEENKKHEEEKIEVSSRDENIDEEKASDEEEEIVLTPNEMEVLNLIKEKEIAYQALYEELNKRIDLNNEENIELVKLLCDIDTLLATSSFAIAEIITAFHIFMDVFDVDAQRVYCSVIENVNKNMDELTDEDMEADLNQETFIYN